MQQDTVEDAHSPVAIEGNCSQLEQSRQMFMHNPQLDALLLDSDSGTIGSCKPPPQRACDMLGTLSIKESRLVQDTMQRPRDE